MLDNFLPLHKSCSLWRYFFLDRRILSWKTHDIASHPCIPYIPLIEEQTLLNLLWLAIFWYHNPYQNQNQIIHILNWNTVWDLSQSKHCSVNTLNMSKGLYISTISLFFKSIYINLLIFQQGLNIFLLVRKILVFGLLRTTSFSSKSVIHKFLIILHKFKILFFLQCQIEI